MRTYISFLIIVLLNSMTGFSPQVYSASLQDAEITESEKRQAVEFAQMFWARLQEDRDLRPYLEPTIDQLGDTLLMTLDTSSFPDSMVQKLNQQHFKRFFIVSTNLFYLSELYLWSTLPLDRIDSATPAQRFPGQAAGVMARAKAEPDVSSIEEFEEMLKSWERAIDIMRAEYKVSPPEATKQFKENVAKSQSDIFHPSVMTEKAGVGYPIGTRYLRINVPLLTLLLLPVKDELKIVLVSPWGD